MLSAVRLEYLKIFNQAKNFGISIYRRYADTIIPLGLLLEKISGLITCNTDSITQSKIRKATKINHSQPPEFHFFVFRSVFYKQRSKQNTFRNTMLSVLSTRRLALRNVFQGARYVTSFTGLMKF